MPVIHSRTRAHDRTKTAGRPALHSRVTLPACTLLLLVGLGALTCSREIPPAGDIRFALAEPRSTPANPPEYGFLAIDPQTRAVVAEHNARHAFIPASASKIPTAIAALAVLGPAYRFETKLAMTGTVTDGTLTGDLILQGGGDPALLMRDMADIADGLRRAGIRNVKGRLLVDDSALPRRGIISETMGEDAAYNPGVSALSVHYNTIRARWTEKAEAYPLRKKKKVEPRKRRSSAKKSRRKRKPISKDVADYRFYLIPNLPVHRIQSTARLEPQKLGEFQYQLTDERDTWLFSKDFLKKNYRRHMKYLPVRRPAIYAGHVLRKFAELRGIELPEPEEGVLPPMHQVVYVHRGRELAGLSETMLHWSNNLMADLLLLSTAKQLKGAPVESLEEAGRIVGGFWQRVLPNVDWSTLVLANGSGLTGANRISPEQMVAMLLWADRQTFAGQRFANSLPLTGWSGSLRKRLRFPETNFRVQAKTGTIFYGVALAGEYYDRYNRRRLFAQFYHDPQKRGLMDDPKHPKSRWARRGGYGWIRRSREDLDDRLLHWILKPADPPQKVAAAQGPAGR